MAEWDYYGEYDNEENLDEGEEVKDGV